MCKMLQVYEDTGGRGTKISMGCPIGERRGGITHKNGISNRVYQTISKEIKEIK